MRINRHKKKQDTGVGEVVSQSLNEFFSDQLRIKFNALPRRQRELITSAKEDGIDWRGEDTHHKLPQLDGLTHFEHVIRECLLMRDLGIEEYKRQHVNSLRRHGVKI